MKIFVGDSLAGNDTVSQAREFYKYTKFDGSILTKSDADARGGAALSIVKTTLTPIMYLGTGQEYDDLIEFSKDTFLETVFGDVKKIEDAHEIPKTEPQLEAESQPESKSEPKLEPKIEEENVIKELEDEADPFEGIATADINKYADLFDVPPPENDEQARELAKKVRNWKSSGRPNP